MYPTQSAQGSAPYGSPAPAFYRQSQERLVQMQVVQNAMQHTGPSSGSSCGPPSRVDLREVWVLHDAPEHAPIMLAHGPDSHPLPYASAISIGDRALSSGGTGLFSSSSDGSLSNMPFLLQQPHQQTSHQQQPQLFHSSSSSGGDGMVAGPQQLRWLAPVGNGVVVGHVVEAMPLVQPHHHAVAPPQALPLTASLYVKNLPPGFNELTLYQTFSPYGALTSCKIGTDPHTGKCRGVGFVNFIEQDSALRAIAQLHGMRIGEGRCLHVTMQGPRVITHAAVWPAHRGPVIM